MSLSFLDTTCLLCFASPPTGVPVKMQTLDADTIIPAQTLLTLRYKSPGRGWPCDLRGWKDVFAPSSNFFLCVTVTKMQIWCLGSSNHPWVSLGLGSPASLTRLCFIPSWKQVEIIKYLEGSTEILFPCSTTSVLGYQHNQPPSPPWLPGNFSPPASCFASSQKSSSQLLAHKIIKTSSKSEQPLTPPIPLLIVQINKSTLHH